IRADHVRVLRAVPPDAGHGDRPRGRGAGVLRGRPVGDRRTGPQGAHRRSRPRVGARPGHRPVLSAPQPVRLSDGAGWRPDLVHAWSAVCFLHRFRRRRARLLNVRILGRCRRCRGEKRRSRTRLCERIERRREMMPRSLGPLLLASVVASGSHAQEHDAQKAREVITAAIAAKGGKQRLLRLPAWHIKYRETFLRDGKKTVETGDAYEHLARGQARYETGPDDVIVVNGGEGWIKKGGKVTALTAGQVADFQEYLKGKEAMLTLLPLLTDEWQGSYLGGKDVDGRAAAVLRITHKKGTATTYWDKNSHLLVRAAYPHKRLIEADDARSKATTREARFSNFKPFKGIVFHTRLRMFSGEKQLGEVEFTAVEPMRQLPESLIAAPR